MSATSRRPLEAGTAQRPLQTRGALFVVYAGYCARYLSLLILIPYYGRVLGAAEYGRVLTAMSLYMVVWLIGNYSFSVIGVRTIAGVSDRAQLAREVARHLKARALLALAGLAIGLAATWLSPVLRADPFYGVAATATGIVSSFNLGWFFQGTRRHGRSIALEAAGFALQVVLVLSLVRGPRDGWLVLASLFASIAIVTACAYLLVWRQLRLPLWRGGGARALIREGASMFVVGGTPQLSLNAASYIVSLVATPVQVGWFGSAERLTAAVLGLMAPANQVLVGAVSERLKDSRARREGHLLMRQSTIALTAFGLLAAMATIGLAPFIVPLVFGRGFEPAVPILQTLALLFPFAAFAQAATAYVLVPLHEERLALPITLSCAALNLLAMFVLAMQLGGQGAAIARVATDVLAAGLLARLLWKLGLHVRLRSKEAR